MAKETKVVESSEVKFTDDELKSLQDLQTNYQEKQAALGQLSVQRILVNQQMETLDIRQDELETEYTAVQQEERDLVQGLNEKYGPGQLDPQTGIFTSTLGNLLYTYNRITILVLIHKILGEKKWQKEL